MASFPLLSSGAVTQYPVQLITGQGTQVIRFLDGSDQRYLMQGKPLRRWQIRMDLLNDRELEQLEAFFEEQEGDYLPFSFPDPFSGATVANCRLGNSSLASNYLAASVGSAALWVIETNG
jgi:Conserved hypothetical protein 2217 (DUF2460)